MKRENASKTALIILLASVLILTFNIQQARSEPETIVVPDDYEQIKWAIGNATDGDTVYVRAGTYRENVTIDKSISLVGESRETTIINYWREGRSLTITADHVTLSGFTIMNATHENIRLFGNFATISDNNLSIVDPAIYGIYAYNTTGHIIMDNIIEYWRPSDVGVYVTGIELLCTNETTVTRNRISYVGYGIYVHRSDNDIISHNNVYSNGVLGIGIMLYVANGNTVFGNNAFNLAYGISTAVSNNNVFCRNNCSLNLAGISIGGDYNIVYGNTISRNGWFDPPAMGGGLYLTFASNSIIRGNIISLNDLGISLLRSNDNQIFHNNFIDNTQQTRISDPCTNSWNDGYPSGGNYWSDYAGVDSDGDGLGDTPYIVDAANQDNYPLMAARLVPSVDESEDYVGYLDDAVQELSDDVFVRTEDADIADLKDDCSDLFADALENIQEGDYEGAIDKLNSIKALMNEEITESAERAELVSLIDDFIAHLEAFL
jgi:nitrous oxidase accessory protein